MKVLAAFCLVGLLLGCRTTKVVVVTTVVKGNSTERWTEYPMDTKAVKKLLDDTLSVEELEGQYEGQ